MQTYIFWGKLKLTVSKDGGPESILGSEASGIKLNSTDFDSYIDPETRNVYKVTQKITGTVADVEDGQIVTITSSTGESHTAKVIDGKYEVEFKTIDPKATYTAKVSDLVGNEAQATSAKLNVATDLIDAIDNDTSGSANNKDANTGIDDATKYYKFTIDDITQTDKFSSNAPLPVLSDKTPTFTGEIDKDAASAEIVVLDKNGHKVFTKVLSQSEFSNGKFEVTSDSLEDGNYKIKATAIFKNGENKTSSTVVSDFVVDKTPVTIENIKVIEDDNDGLKHTIKFNLKNYEDGDKIESIKMIKADGTTEIVPFGATKPTNGVLSVEYNNRIKLGDKIEVEMTDNAGTKYTHVNEILVPAMTQFENSNDTTTNAAGRSAEKLWSTMDMSESGFRADGSRIVSNDAVPYIRAVVPKDREIPASNFVATNVDSGEIKNLAIQARNEGPIRNVTPEHYDRITGFNNKIFSGLEGMQDGVYKISIDGKYGNGDKFLFNSIKFTIDATAATIDNSNFNYDAAAGKTTWSGKLSENGVGASYTLKQHFEEAAKGISLKDSITIRDTNGNIIQADTDSVDIDNDGHFRAIFNGDVKASDVYLQISDIAKNTRVVADNDNNNVIKTSEGNDIINVGNGDNIIHAGGGENVITTGNGKNRIITGNSDDVITTGSGDDYIDSGLGNYNGSKIGDKVNAGGGDDRVVFNYNGGLSLVQRLDGGEGTDTLIMRPVAKDGTIDFNKINGKEFNSTVQNFEKIQLGADADGNDNQAIKMLNLKPDDALSITDNINTILKIDGKNDDSISLKGFTKTNDQTNVEHGYTRYEGQTSTATPTTIYIDVDNDINKQLV